VVFFLATLLVAQTAAAVDPAWLPLRAGNRWLYELHRDRSYRPLDKSIDRSFETGRGVMTARAARDGPEHAFEMLQSMRSEPLDGRKGTTSLSSTVMSFGEEWLLHASGPLASDASTPSNRYVPPLRMLPTTAVGQSWKVGTWREGDLEIELRGEVRALEAKPECPGCISVRYAGKLKGTIPWEAGSATVESGRLEREIWLQRGVGVVRDVTTTETELQLPDESSAHVVDVMTLRLLDHDLEN